MGDDHTALLTALALFLLGATLAAIEASLLAVPDARMRAIRDEQGDPAGLIDRYLDDPARVLTRLLAGRVFAPLMAMALATRTLLSQTAAWWQIALVLVSVALFYALLNLLAVTFGRGRAARIAPRALFWSRPLLLLFAPVALPMQRVGLWAARQLREGGAADDSQVTEREVEYVVEQAQSAGTVDPMSSAMLQNVFDVKSQSARDVMVPRTQIVALEQNTSIAEALRRFNEEGHSRVPVFREQIDNVVGTLHAKDLYRHAVQRADGATGGGAEVTLEDLVRKPPFLVSDTQPALSVLRDMQQRQAHLAVVVDEYGSVVGLVTLEDILEEIVGDIQDEHDSAEQEFEALGEDRWIASAAMPVSTLEERLSVNFPEREDYASLGGFLAAHAGRVPVVGTVVVWAGFRFIVREGDKRRATKVEILRTGDAVPA
jgi:CBS domain containing-hemolysin-like protein